MKRHPVDYQFAQARANTLLTRKCSTDTLVSPCFIGSLFCPDVRICPRLTALNTCLPFKFEKPVIYSDRVEAAKRAACSFHSLRFFSDIGYFRLAKLFAKAISYAKPCRVYFRTPGNNVSFRKLFIQYPYLNKSR